MSLTLRGGSEAVPRGPVHPGGGRAAAACGRASGRGGRAQCLYADYAGRLVDLKGVGRFPAFSGEGADWPEWRFRFENGADLIDMGDAMTMAVQAKQPIEFNRLLSKYAQRAKLLYGVLVQACSGRALSLLRLVRQRNGLEGWRQLVAEYKPATASSATAMLAALLTPTWGQRHFLD